ncbi:hypothetical protein V2J09_004025 [Rumex salicifolius]
MAAEESTGNLGMETVVEVEDDEHDSKERVLHKYFLKEWSTVNSILNTILSDGRVSDISSVHQIRSIMDKYQEQGQLLEPYLESIVSPLMLLIRSKAIEMGPESDDILEVLKPVSIIIYTLVTVCGYKPVINFFPHQVSDLELAVSLLDKCHNTNASMLLRQESTGEMEAKCVLLLWLSILVLVPFDISSVDSSMGQNTNLNEEEVPPLVSRILTFCKDYLSNAGPMRTIAGLLLSKLLTRPDMLKAFSSFFEWANEVMAAPSDNAIDHFRSLGVLEALAAIFKSGSREILLSAVPNVWNDALKLMKSGDASHSPLLRKYLVKLAQRVGLTCLHHRTPTWHYKGKLTSLGNITLLNSRRDDADAVGATSDNAAAVTFEEEEDMDVPETVEEIIEVLLVGLKDRDTVVRWSAAKGLGRITARLTCSLADEVLSSVLELFSSREGDGSWHGGCLALAELARRGLLLPISLPKVVPVVAKALHYDIRRGPHSVGAHVRDAAAYVCWAFGRAYYHTDMRNVLEQLASHLLRVACYDREVNCRRAAAAAFQENVGRQGDFPHGIDIVNTADYFALSSRTNSYIHVAVCIAQYEGYLCPFVDELLNSKICHWEEGLRKLASEALAALVKYNPEYFASFVLDKIIPCTLSTDLCTRHGATLAAGEAVLALHQCDHALSTDRQKQLASVVPAIEKARLYRGKGGEIMRSAVSRFIECISLAEIYLPEKIRRGLLDTLNENLRHPNSQIQTVAVNALKHFIPAYYLPVDEKGIVNITFKYMNQLNDPNAAVRRGSALALGVLPYEYLAKNWKDLLLKLCKSCLIEDKPDDCDAEARVNAVQGLASICETLTESRVDTEDYMSLLLIIKIEVMESLFKALDDYSVDNRGDVGSWVRKAAIDGLERCTYILCKDYLVESKSAPLTDETVIANQLFDVDLATNLVTGLIKQAVEKMDKLREVAANTLQRILYNKTFFVPFIPYKEELQEYFPAEVAQKWGDPTFSYPRFVQLLQFSCYSRHLLSGLVIAIGGLQDSLKKTSLTALLEYLHPTNGNEEISSRELSLSMDILWVLEQYKRCDRVIVPTLKTIEILLGRKVFLNMETHTAKFFASMLNALRDELRGTKDFPKLNAGIAILGYIASFDDAINSKAFSHLLTLLGHRFPAIRKAVAEQVYLVLLQNSTFVAGDEMDLALELVSETCWEGDIEYVRQKRLQLFELAGLDTGTLHKPGYAAPKKAILQHKMSDENASYSSLVESSGF